MGTYRDEEESKVEGIEHVNYTIKASGDKIDGVNVYLSKPITGDGQGVKFEKVFFSKERYSALKNGIAIGATVIPRYNRYGKVYSLTKVDEALDFGE